MLLWFLWHNTALCGDAVLTTRIRVSSPCGWTSCHWADLSEGCSARPQEEKLVCVCDFAFDEPSNIFCTLNLVATRPHQLNPYAVWKPTEASRLYTHTENECMPSGTVAAFSNAVYTICYFNGAKLYVSLISVASLNRGDWLSCVEKLSVLQFLHFDGNYSNIWDQKRLFEREQNLVKSVIFI